MGPNRPRGLGRDWTRAKGRTTAWERRSPAGERSHSERRTTVSTRQFWVVHSQNGRRRKPGCLAPHYCTVLLRCVGKLAAGRIEKHAEAQYKQQTRRLLLELLLLNYWLLNRHDYSARWTTLYLLLLYRLLQYETASGQILAAVANPVPVFENFLAQIHWNDARNTNEDPPGF